MAKKLVWIYKRVKQLNNEVGFVSVDEADIPALITAKAAELFEDVQVEALSYIDLDAPVVDITPNPIKTPAKPATANPAPPADEPEKKKKKKKKK